MAMGRYIMVDVCEVFTGLEALHYENTLIQIYWKFYNQKKEKF